MKASERKFELSRLITRHLAGELSDEERQCLEAWLAESKRHREFFDHVRSERVLWEKLQAYEQIDVEQALAGFLAEKRKRERIKRYPLFRFARYAGIVLLPLLAVGWWLFGRVGGLPSPAEQDGALLPRQLSHITLSTLSGESIDLPSSLPSEQHIEPDLVLKQDSGLVRLLPVVRDGVPREESYRTVSVPSGGEFKIMLEDGTKVWLNAETKFSFPLEFIGERRRVVLEGEAYFEVAPDAGRSFVVETSCATVTVYGTSFNLSTDARRARTVATLVSGSVGFRVHATEEEIAMSPGEQVVLTGAGWNKREVIPSFYTSWREGWLNFFSERLEDMLAVIARWYNVEVIFVNEEAKEVLYTGQVRRYEDFREVLDIISLTRSVRFSIDGRTIIVH
ncbi:MAG: DUF4974 domain-containing protein [Odoribacteraceae bacterium]|nr:DUF4974 domain-containing protein [Odoribacteraceae bacterium]